MSLYQNGDFMAFEQLYNRHSGRVFEFLKKRTPATEVAMDLTQETFEKLHQSRSKYDPQYPFLPWLFTISRNALLDYFKRADTRLMISTAEPEAVSGKLAWTDTETHVPDISPVLALLPESQRRAIELRYLQDWSFEQIATRMDTSEVNARKLISRGLAKIRTLLENEGGGHGA